MCKQKQTLEKSGCWYKSAQNGQRLPWKRGEQSGREVGAGGGKHSVARTWPTPLSSASRSGCGRDILVGQMFPQCYLGQKADKAGKVPFECPCSF